MTTTKPLSKKAQKEADRAEAIAELHKLLKPGDTVLGLVRQVSRSGMSRQIDFYVSRADGLVYLSGYVARALDYTRADNGALKVGGAGMDMVFAVVHSLGYAMWPKGTPEPHGRRNGGPDSNGGYALKHGHI
jgi:hypothetical protein